MSSKYILTKMLLGFNASSAAERERERRWGEELGGGGGYGRKIAGESCYNYLYALIICDTQAVCKETMINDMYQCIRL